MSQAEINIGVVGHVDHGKTSLVKALSGKWTDTHSEELKRGITIKLGYADVDFRKCPKCGEYTTKEKCPKCGAKTEVLRRVSFVDAPGHEMLMATVIAASSIMDGALFVIAANEKCPQPQTLEHLMVLETTNIKNVVIAQNKVDLVTKEQAMKNYEEIKAFIKGTSIENAPIIPVSANSNTNLDVLIEAIEKFIQTPKRDETKEPVMFVARSFDVNRPGADINNLVGAIVGGSVVCGKFKVGDEIELSPGAAMEKHYAPIYTRITNISAGSSGRLKEAKPGGLIAIATDCDPALSSGDKLVGNVVGKRGELPEMRRKIKIKINPLKRTLEKFSGIQKNEPMVIGVGTAISVGFVREIHHFKVELELKRPVCIRGPEDRIALLRKVGNRWRLYGSAVLIE